MVKLPHTVDVSNLSDDDLFKKLKDLGVDVGPIVGSTRKIYERKLQGLLSDNSVSSESGSRQEFEDEVVDHEDNKIKEDAYQSQKSEIYTSYNSPDLSSSNLYLANLRRPELSHSTCSTTTSSFQNKVNSPSSRLEESSKTHENQDQNLQSSSSSSLGIFVKLAFGVAVIAFLIFIVCQNMESDKKNPIPNL